MECHRGESALVGDSMSSRGRGLHVNRQLRDGKLHTPFSLLYAFVSVLEGDVSDVDVFDKTSVKTHPELPY